MNGSRIHETAPIADWQVERTKLLQAVCMSIAAAVQKGLPVREAARRLSRRWNRRVLDSGSGRYLRLSLSTAVRHYYAWTTSRSPDCFHLGYGRRLPTGHRALVAELVSKFDEQHDKDRCAILAGLAVLPEILKVHDAGRFGLRVSYPTPAHREAARQIRAKMRAARGNGVIA